MSYSINFILSFAGSLCATSCLAAGEALRTSDRSFLKRMTPRMLLSLALLSCATVGTALALFLPPATIAPGPCISLLFLAAGTGATLWAYVAGPPQRGGESLGERITRRGMLALALLTVSQFIDMGGGPALAAVANAVGPSGHRAREALEHLQASGQQSVPILALLALFLMALGTGVALATFRSRGPLAPEGGPFLKRMSPLAKGTFLILGLALVVVGIASLLKPEVGVFICLMLLTLGIVSGLLALFFTAKPGVAEPAPGGISSRGWVSLTLLALAGVVLVAQEAHVFGPLTARMDASQPSARVPSPSATGSGVGAARTPGPASPNYGVVDLTKGLRASSGTTVPSRNVEDEKPQRKQHSPNYKVVDLTKGVRAASGTTVPSRNVEDEKAQLKQEIQELKRQVQNLESRLLALQAQPTRGPGTPATSGPGPTARNASPVVVDLTNGLRRR
jgi:hypothetical protein